AYIQSTATPPGEEHGAQRLESDRDAVQVLTIHKSKGLEASVVAVFGGFGRATQPPALRVWHEGNERRFLFGRGEGEVERRATVEEREEEQRLLYVALTRARARVLLPVVEAPVAGCYGALNERLRAIAGRLAGEPRLAELFE